MYLVSQRPHATLDCKYFKKHWISHKNDSIVIHVIPEELSCNEISFSTIDVVGPYTITQFTLLTFIHKTHMPNG